MNDLYKNIKKISDKAMEINTLAIKNMPETSTFSNKLKEIINPLLEAQRIWVDSLDIRNPFKDLNIDFSKIEENTRKGCEKMISKGYYPYKKMGTSTCLSIVNLENDSEIEKILSENVEYDIKVLKKDILINFKDYSNDIKEIYELYNSEKYRLCILSLINILSQIFNKSFECKDFTETDEIVLKNYNIMNLSNEEYYQFMPYCIIYDGKKVRKYDNALLNNYKNKREKYADFPYNRNAILHGYSNDFGNKNNCLRWFSVLLNTNDIFEYNK